MRWEDEFNNSKIDSPCPFGLGDYCEVIPLAKQMVKKYFLFISTMNSFAIS